MKILKIFGIVVGIHVFALILIFANPGCSSTTRPAPAPADTVASSQPTGPTITMPNLISSAGAAEVPPSGGASASVGFNPDAPATYASTSGPGVRFTPTRPNTAAASAVLAQPVENVTPAATYKVKAGDSLWTIAKRNHISVADLAGANNLRTSSVLRQGQMLIIPSKSPTPVATSVASPVTTTTAAAAPAGKIAESASPAANGEIKYVVKPGETLGMIARKFGVKAREIGARNNINDPQKLRAGTELVIPGWQKPGTKTARSAAGESERASAATTTSTPASAPVPNILDQPDQSQNQLPPNNIPVIKIDDTPSTPAPKS